MSLQTAHKSDELLLHGLLNSDAERIRALYDMALPAIIYYIREQGGTEADARDLFQEALIAVYKRLQAGDFELTCKLSSYLRVICRNLWLKRQRKYKREADELPSHWEPVSLDESTEEVLENSERDNLLWKYFGQLTENCQRVLRLFFAGTSMKEIAAQLDSTEGYIKKRNHACKQKLVEAVRKDSKYRELRFD